MQLNKQAYVNVILHCRRAEVLMDIYHLHLICWLTIRCGKGQRGHETLIMRKFTHLALEAGSLKLSCFLSSCPPLSQRMSGIEVVLPVVGPILSRRALKAGSCVTFYGQNIDQHRVTFYPCSALLYRPKYRSGGEEEGGNAQRHIISTVRC